MLAADLAMYLDSIRNQRQLSRAGLVLALYGALSLLAVLIAAGRDDIDIYRIEGVSTPTLLLVSPVIGLALGLLVVALTRVATSRFEWARHLHRSFRGLLGRLSGREILIIALASSVGEELLFRGALQPAVGVWWQAALFALLHIGPSRDLLPWTIWALAMGLIFGVLVEVTGNLGAPIVAHFTINFLNLRHIARVELPAPDLGTEPSPTGAEAS